MSKSAEFLAEHVRRLVYRRDMPSRLSAARPAGAVPPSHGEAGALGAGEARAPAHPRPGLSLGALPCPEQQSAEAPPQPHPAPASALPGSLGLRLDVSCGLCDPGWALGPLSPAPLCTSGTVTLLPVSQGRDGI